MTVAVDIRIDASIETKIAPGQCEIDGAVMRFADAALAGGRPCDLGNDRASPIAKARR